MKCEQVTGNLMQRCNALCMHTSLCHVRTGSVPCDREEWGGFASKTGMRTYKVMKSSLKSCLLVSPLISCELIGQF